MKPNLQSIELNAAATMPDPFKPESLRLDLTFTDGAAVKKLLTSIPVRKPNKQDWLRVHSAEDHRLAVALITLKEDRETYLVTPPPR